MATFKSRMRGTIYGTAVCDALGGPRQFIERDELPLLTQMEPIANFNAPRGSWSDDTSMTLCLAESLTLTGRGEQNLAEQIERYSRWHDTGYNTSIGRAFDVGGTTRRAIKQFAVTGNPIATTTDDSQQGNGSLMRTGPIAVMFAADPERAGREAALSSLTTHTNPVCQQSCHILASVIATALQGNTKPDVIAACRYSGPGPCREELLPIIAHEFLDKTRKEIQSDGWVVSTLEAALWAFARTDTFQDGAILAVNLAHDADTVGAVYGAIAGAFYGYEAIPLEWLEDLKAKIVIENVYVPFEARVLAGN